MEVLKRKRTDKEGFSTMQSKYHQPATKHDIELLEARIKSEFSVLRLQMLAGLSWAFTILLILDKIF